MTAPQLISIVLPTFNGSAHLRGAVDSCLGQSYKNLELIIVNDGSTDPTTHEILGRQTDPRVRVIHLEKNAGLPEALNTGFRAARGELMTWTSDDNLYRPSALEAMAHVLTESGMDFVYAHAASIDEDDNETGQLAILPPDHLIHDNCIGPCFLFTRRVREETGFYNPEHRLVEDYDYWLRVSKHFQMRRIAADLYLYRFHSKALTSTEGNERIVAAREKVRRLYFSHAEICAADGLRAYARRDYSTARMFLVRSVMHNPFGKDLYKPLLVSMIPDGILKVILRFKRVGRE